MFKKNLEKKVPLSPEEELINEGVTMFKRNDEVLVENLPCNMNDEDFKTVTETASNQKQSKAAQSVTIPTVAIVSGTFDGRSDHVTSGGVSVEKTATGYQLRFAEDFFLDGAPDPVVALGNDQTYNASNKLGPLKNKEGSQTYALPASFKLGQFKEVYVWCERFSVPLGVATLRNS